MLRKEAHRLHDKICDFLEPGFDQRLVRVRHPSRFRKPLSEPIGLRTRARVLRKQAVRCPTACTTLGQVSSIAKNITE